MVKRFAFILLLFFSANSALPAQTFSPDKNLKSLLDSGEYFRFREAFRVEYINSLHSDNSNINSPENLYFLAWEEFLFNQPAESNKHINALLKHKTFSCPDSVAAEMLTLHFQNDIRLFNYKRSDSACTVLLSRYTSVLAPKMLAEIENTAAIVKALVNVPAQTLERQGDLEMDYKRDIANLIRIPVTVNKETENFIFDTGANFSCVSESQAKKMGIKILEADFAVTSSSRAAVQSKLGVADELKIGNMIFRNVVFLVLPDKSLKFIGGLYKIKGIIGLPVIAQMKQVTITKAGKITSTENYSGTHTVNLGLEGNTPFVSVNFYGETHNYVFDTGAAASVFGNKFYTAYNDSLGDSKEGTTHVGGAGGMQKITTRSAKNVGYQFAGATGVLKSALIQQSGVTDVLGVNYGIVGEDIFMQWETMTMNFESMFVELK